MDQRIVSTVETADDITAADKAKLYQETQAIIDALTAPAYVAALRAVRDAPVEKRLLEATQRLTPDALRAAGVELPKGMRISSRYFEPDIPKPLEFGDMPDGKENPLVKLGKSNPGLLDDLRANNPHAFAAISDGGPAMVMEEKMLARIGGCTCGGGPLPVLPGTACGGGGYYL